MAAASGTMSLRSWSSAVRRAGPSRSSAKRPSTERRNRLSVFHAWNVSNPLAYPKVGETFALAETANV
jgi:hypothetical protein